ncbi:hypothetical protein LN565_16190 [Xanthomonas euvesicatoria pv. euvesicatoria]|uniref:Uncharacterized protein n=2 Tax=Xanthomonas euvesicatoria TaxID=456327 RepID=A0A6B3KMD4_XANEU|nr:hypothetical protein [Xanthomonas euvesicatoria]AOY66212.1 hypothetical protein BHE83_06280 [Xanthomonas euvesicatoria pv. vesicatoria str. 85-10]APO90212.1 hypothetical protein BJD11_09250 [Xanthomonas euvesicatoria]KHL60635.1 hypothetical protein XEU66b_15220 [Xanthomonas euvesicatoria]KHL66257.1 hypothetical protein XEU83M_07715 [Xanthomonas euvesicatoria]KLA49977.1 hypothetical protein XEUV683_20410 [Xanthomonas euvesicatoria]
MNEHSHLVYVDEESRKLLIYRLSEKGKKTLLTDISLPIEQGWSSDLESIAKQLGENLLMDSPAARRLLDI